MIMNNFPIGFWQHSKPCENTAETVKEWAKLGMTLAFPSDYREGDDPKRTLNVLDACAEYGIKAVVRDLRVVWKDASVSPEEYEKKFRISYEMFGHHPAVLGFYIGDEPKTEKDYTDCIEASLIQNRVAPELTPYLNFLPYKENVTENIIGSTDFDGWLTDMVKKSQLKILSYDCYSHMRGDMEGVNTYFTNLRRFMEASKETGAVPWNCILSAGHFNFRCPDEDDLRWQLHTSVASGMKGITWFLIYSYEPITNLRKMPINEFGEHTETFDWLSRVNRYFLKQYGDFFNRAEHISTYHLINTYGGYKHFIAGREDDAIVSIESQQKVDGLVSYFTLDENKYLVLVNNSPDTNGRFIIKAKADREYAYLDWNGNFAPVSRPWQDPLEIASVGSVGVQTLLCDWLAPGQMKVYRI